MSLRFGDIIPQSYPSNGFIWLMFKAKWLKMIHFCKQEEKYLRETKNYYKTA